MNREHHFYCAIAKHVFAHPTHGLVRVRDPIRLDDAKEFGLQPLLLYGVTVAGTAIQRISLSPLENLKPFSAVLEEAWRSAPGLKGKPDTVKVNRFIAHACPNLAKSLESVGTRLVVADAQEKRLPASLRSAQQNAMWSGFFPYDRHRITSVEAFNSACLERHKLMLHPNLWETGDADQTARTEQWLALPYQPLATSTPDSGSWPPGSWLSSWQAALPQGMQRHWHVAEDGNVWLLEGASELGYENDDAYDEDDPDYLAETAKVLIACWPSKLGQIAAEIGTTQRELQWFLNGRATIPAEAQRRLINLLGLRYRDEYDEFEPYYSLVLVASSLKATIAAYDAISHGGDLKLALEVVPKDGAADPSWRYVVIESFSGLPTIIMFARGSAVAESLNKSKFINYQGLQPIEKNVYRELVEACAKACSSTAENRNSAMAFVRRHCDYFQRFAKYY